MDGPELERLRRLMTALRETEIPPATEKRLLEAFNSCGVPVRCCDKLCGAPVRTFQWISVLLALSTCTLDEGRS